MKRQHRVSICATGAFAVVFVGWVALATSNGSQPPPAGQVTLPNSPVGQCAAAYLEALNSGDDDRVRDFMQRYRKESYIKKHTMKGLLKTPRMVHESWGILTPIRVAHSTDHEVTLFAWASRIRGFAELHFEMDEKNPGKLVVFTIDGGIDRATAEGTLKPIDNGIINTTVESVAGILRDSYVYPDKGEKMADLLIRNKSEGRYAGITDSRVLATKLTQDLRAFSRDRHLGVHQGSLPTRTAALPAEPGQPTSDEGQVDWPNTPAGCKAKAYFAVEDNGDVLRRFIQKNFSKAVLKEQSLDSIFGHHSVMRSASGKVTVHSATADGDYAVEVSIVTERTGRERLRVEVSPKPPHGITTFEDAMHKIEPTAEDVRGNYGFRKVEVLPDNIGYIRFDMFHESEKALKVAAAALEFVANCDALVFDLRNNYGGTWHMNRFIASYLFDKAIHLGGRYNRLTGETEEWSTLEEVPGKQFGPDVPVYILTSPHTASAAEAFTYWLKDLKRVVVVGETSVGAAHSTTDRSVNDDFWISIPISRTISPVTKTDWEGVGIVPDIKVPASQALEAACQDAAKKIQARRESHGEES
ncbi:MAG: hypothetical protein JSU86_20185 [Phycisphaerales bacterium]|nr:MAG: hypothetical protein JSU86_20185 [Phycisphaerales bacterium]